MTKPKKRSYPLEPRDLSPTAWFFEIRKGIEVVQEHRGPNDEYQGTVCVIIPWTMIGAALTNHRKATKRPKTSAQRARP